MIRLRPKGAATSAQNPEDLLKEWKARRQEIHRERAHRHMKQAVHDAAKKEGEHKARQRKVQQTAKPKR